MPPNYVKPYVKRGKSDAADAEAICEAVTRPTMRTVPVKSANQQALLCQHRTRELLVGQRTQLSNAIRGLLGEFGETIRKGATWPRLSGPYVFGAGSDGSKAFNGRSKGMMRMRKGGIAGDLRLHDLRRTAVTLAQRSGAGIDEIKALTQHKVSGVIGVYARHGYETEKRKVVEIIEAQLDSIV